jgi:hypothetical protein
LDVSIAMRLNFMRAALGWCMTTQLWHEMPLGRPPQQPPLTPTLGHMVPGMPAQAGIHYFGRIDP